VNFFERIGRTAAGVPGGILVAATALPHAVVQAGAEIVKDVAHATHNQAVEQGALAVLQVDQHIISAAISDPVNSLKVVGGAALVASGVGVPAGAAAIATGVLGLAQDVLKPAPPSAPPAGKPTQQNPSPGAVPVAKPTAQPAIDAAAPHPELPQHLSLWRRFTQWLRRTQRKSS
jgi:hypothetical protein